jgi:hypothetical protein
MNYNGINSFTMFFSASFSQSFLKNCYQKQNIVQAEQKSYQNCYPFMYYLEHGRVYYQQAETAPLLIQPILLFYGFVHLIKACILTKDPNYPETTSVLAHGVSSRKRKKQQYNFLDDDVKIQKTGLFPLMSEKLFHMKQMEGEKVTMEKLFVCIPELECLFWQLERKKIFLNARQEANDFYISNKILDSFHMTENRFEAFLNSKFQFAFSVSESCKDELKIAVSGQPAIFGEVLPFRFHLSEKRFLFPLEKNAFLHYPELLIHYLLLYNLSMIARYETEWWSELMKMMPNNDFPFIHFFLETTLKKGPFLIYDFLMGELQK